ncbi:SdpI family protein [Pseudonocardia sp. KRD-184]|uniref:SdpI family protein n=1 Tax=Pseudonocardia oceani TaxID=2792013 RepID=A0ABS6U9U8_9PSEU|nr:SdpI family protein [Pseudonocardia oceani]MBW0099766.1 SdpI family protein [Pseudonocardia oceani]MBW0112427.1 SdpI family protein [Pseudonocardia oceani]MBW0124602.1 SdpI family protein [Pseudonocardia oceani]MBW0128929.1 SdpI family protein [Pseudonocardia oceani]
MTYPGRVPLVPRLVLAALFVIAGLALLAVAVLGARGRLPRNRWAGVRTPETLASDAAFALANRVAAAPLGAAGAVAVVGGAVLAAGPAGAVSVVVLVVTALGALVLAVFGGMVGQRAAAAVPVPAAAPACAGACAGCDLVAGCRPAAATSPAATSPTSPDRP